MIQHPHLALPNYAEKDVWKYYALLWIHPIVFDDLLLVILQMPLVDKSFMMNVYRA